MAKRRITVNVKDRAVAQHLAPLLTACGFAVHCYGDTHFGTPFGVEAPWLDELPSREDAYWAAVDICSYVGAIIQIYEPGLDATLTVTGVNEAGSATSAPGILRIISGEAFDHLGANGGELIARLMRHAQSNDDVARLLRNLQGRPSSWADLYDVMEFFGGQNGIVSRGWTDTDTASLHMRTAGFHRHPLDKNGQLHLKPGQVAPTIEETRKFVMGLVRGWLEGMP